MGIERNYRKVFERRMKHLLKHINTTGKLPELDEYDKECLYHCVAEKGYVRGVVSQRMVSGRVVFDISSDRLTLTKAGLDFCWKPIPWEAGANIVLAVITAISIAVAIFQSLS